MSNQNQNDTRPALTRFVLSNSTLVTLGGAAAVVVPLLLAVSWVRDGQLANQQATKEASAAATAAINALRTELSYKIEVLSDRSQGNVTISELEVVLLKFARDNPALKVPELRR